MKILIVDDESPIRELIRFNIEKAGFTSVQAENASQAISLARSETPGLIILDLMLPDMSGLDVCRVLKSDSSTKHIPVIMVTAKTEDSDIVTGLELGADDYVTKPFSPKVLTARIASVLRRVNTAENPEKDPEAGIKIRDIFINPIRHEIKINGSSVDFSATEFAILEFLGQHPGQVFSRLQIINAVKGDSYPVTERAIDVQILGIRRKIEEADGGDIIETIRGVGYRMCEDTGSKT